MTSEPVILLIDDNPNDRLLVIRELIQEFSQADVVQVTDANDLSEAFHAGGFQLVVTDYQLRWTDGLAILHTVKEQWPNCPVIMFTGTGNEDVAVEAMKSGLEDYIVKSPKHFFRLRAAARKALQQADVQVALIESEDRYRHLIESVPDIIFATSPEGIICELNPAFARITGLSAEQWLGQSFLSIVHPDDLSVAQDALRLTLKGEVPPSFELKVLTRSGIRTFVEINVTPRMSEGKITGVLGIARDITERKRAEEGLKIIEKRLVKIFNSCPVGMCITTIEDGTFLDVNDVFCEMGRCNREEVIGRNALELGYWQVPSDREKLVRNIATHGTLKSDEFAFRNKDGTSGYALRSIERLTLDGQDCILSMFIDITDRKKIEDELRSSRQRLESLSRQLITTQETERRHLARELHDEIGQVLTAIKMNLRRTHQAADASVQSHLQENIEMVDQAIVDVRNLALRLRPPQLDELGLGAALHWLLKNQARLKGLEERLDVDLGDFQISAELETVCFRIAQEALTNAIRHGEPSSVHVKLRASENELHLMIRDDGVGFDVIEQRKRTSAGMSLGLSSMQERASLAGGRIEITSTPGHGTTIQTWFPISPS